MSLRNCVGTVQGCLLGAALVSFSAGGEADRRIEPKAAFARIVHARLHDGKTQTLECIGVAGWAENLWDLRPTLVSGLIRLAKDDPITNEMRENHSRARNVLAVLTPTPRVDVVFIASDYEKGEDLVKKMRAINAALSIDQWFFEAFDTSWKAKPDVLRAAIAYAHEKGQLVGGTVAGTEAPAAADYVAVSDAHGLQPMFQQIRDLKSKFSGPVLVHLHNGERNRKDGNEEWGKMWKAPERKVYVTDLARSQEAGKFHLMYPILYPAVSKNVYYDALSDKGMFSTQRLLMNKYNPVPGPK